GGHRGRRDACAPRRRAESARVQDLPLALSRHARRPAPGDAPRRGDRVVEGGRPHRPPGAAHGRPGPALTGRASSHPRPGRRRARRGRRLRGGQSLPRSQRPDGRHVRGVTVMREITFQKALEEAVAEEMRRDPRVITLGTDFTGDPIKEFGASRVRFTPISEAVLTGMGLGAAGCGVRPIVNWRMVTFSFVAMDQVVNQASKIRYMFGGQADFPVTYRCSTGGGNGLADELAREGVSIEVLDPRTLVPMDVETLRASVQKTGRVVIVDEAPATCSAAAEIAALMVEDPDTFRALKAPVRRVCAMPVPVPY